MPTPVNEHLSRLIVRSATGGRRILADSRPVNIVIDVEVVERDPWVRDYGITPFSYTLYQVTVPVEHDPRLAAALLLPEPRTVDAWSRQPDGSYHRYRFALAADTRVDPTWGGSVSVQPGMGNGLTLQVPLSSVAVHPPSLLWSVTRTTSTRESRK